MSEASVGAVGAGAGDSDDSTILVVSSSSSSSSNNHSSSSTLPHSQQPQPQPKLPAWPPKVCDIGFGGARQKAGDDYNHNHNHKGKDKDNNQENNAKSASTPSALAATDTMARPKGLQPRLRRFLPIPVRRAVLTLVTLTGVTLIVVFIWLYRTGHIAHFNAVFKVKCYMPVLPKLITLYPGPRLWSAVLVYPILHPGHPTYYYA
ncbi:hypothetical protein F4809DRAFT_130044 [Biscogniauxia mediterranea]|nr:hypothetical protein F4809DRAFT_130044 [Biscogniauxia mediterranea]